jgi:hypothetical protein
MKTGASKKKASLPLYSSWDQANKLAFPCFSLAESVVINGLRRIQIKFSPALPFLNTRSGCKRRPSALQAALKAGRNARRPRLSPHADLTRTFGFTQTSARGSWPTALSAIDIQARPIPILNRQSSLQYARIIRRFQARASRFHSSRERRRTETRAKPPRASRLID